jgi:hypothetical protein
MSAHNSGRPQMDHGQVKIGDEEASLLEFRDHLFRLSSPYCIENLLGQRPYFTSEGS